jgi:hypothetical protein
MKKVIITFLLVLAVLVLISLLLVSTCTLKTGWSVGVQRSCECIGVEWTLYDQIHVDGVTMSVCIGFIKSKKCYEFKNNKDIVVNCH